MGHGKQEHGNIEKVTDSLNIQKEIENFSQFFLKTNNETKNKSKIQV